MAFLCRQRDQGNPLEHLLEQPILLIPFAELRISNNRLIISIKTGQIKIGEEGSLVVVFSVPQGLLKGLPLV